jgi:histidinol-phosphate/aromatic aminotransferase/cobyric acid decarboxylase-like protein
VIEAAEALVNGTRGGAGSCFHGGAFFEAIGERFDALERRYDVINADVLDAWFPPAPAVLRALSTHLDWLARTSPPTACAGLQAAIADARDLPVDSVLVGAGSSDLIFLALREWLTPRSRVLLLDPCYGEYAHVLEKVVGCRVDRFPLRRADGWAPDLTGLSRRLALGYDLFVLVNPNNPTGHHIPRRDVERVLDSVPSSTRVWVDEAYLEYVAPDESLEHSAVTRPNVCVCKSLSKVYALSGMRAAYLCSRPETVAPLRTITPPWAVSLPAQVAGVHALSEPAYYAERYAETARLRTTLKAALQSVPGVEQVSGNANYLLVHLDPRGPSASSVIARCRAGNIFLRDISPMGQHLGAHLLRTAVKDAHDNARIVEAVERACGQRANAHRRAS